MARIGKADHARILLLVDVEQRKVAEVAAEYGCSAANIYALLGKLRRAAPGREEAAPVAVAPACPPAATPPPAATDLFAAAPESPRPAPTPDPIAAPARSAPHRLEASVTALLPKSPIAQRHGIGAARAKPGFGLTMRTAEGDENVTPFRSLDDLLSAVKPILRAAARSQDAVWFSIQPIDLSLLAYDAA